MEQNEMMESENTIPEKEGGEAFVDPSEEKPKSEVSPKFDISSDPNLDEQTYSEEEYQRFVEFYDRTLSDIRQGQIVVGRVLAVTDLEVLIDIGFKSEGTVPLEEFGDPPDVKVGDKVEVFLETIEDSDGQLVLSKRKATFVRLWDKDVDIYNQGGTIEGKSVRRNKGGNVVDLMGVDAFLPGSQIDVKPIRDFDALIGQTYTFMVVKVNKLRKNIVVSRRALLEESMKEQRKEVLTTLEKGQVREGMVKNITDFGVFVDLGGVDGLLHINDLSWGRVNHPSEVVKLDQKINVVILDFNDAKDRISLGLKQLQPHPWEGIEENFYEGAVVDGKVVSIADYGAFVELQRGVEGLVHVSEMSWTRHGIHPSKMVNVGETIQVKVLSVDKERKRISLGLKQLTPDPWEDIEKKYPIGSKYIGRVRNMTNFGAFVEMEEGIDGLVHISDLSWTRKIKHPSEVLKKGDEIEVVVLDVNKDERRVSLGFKQLGEDPWPEFEDAYKVDTLTNAKVVRFVDKGLIVELPLGLEGFVPLSQMAESSMAKVAQNVKVGDELPFAVIEFDRTNKRVVLSNKKVKEMEDEKKTEAEQEEVKSYVEKQDDAPTLAEIAGEGKEPKKKKSKKKTESEDTPAPEKEEAEEKSVGAEDAEESSIEEMKNEDVQTDSEPNEELPETDEEKSVGAKDTEEFSTEEMKNEDVETDSEPNKELPETDEEKTS
ncbi:MAG: 30S ribosomal protein S1 [bacterium]